MKQKVDLQKSSEIIGFKPTPAMQLFIETAIRLSSDNVAQITREAGIDESNYYKWQKLEGFHEWFNKFWDEALKRNAWRLDSMGFRNARQDFNYWKAMQQRSGRLEDKPSTMQQFNIGKDFNFDKYVEEDDAKKSS